MHQLIFIQKAQVQKAQGIHSKSPKYSFKKPKVFIQKAQSIHSKGPKYSFKRPKVFIQKAETKVLIQKSEDITKIQMIIYPTVKLLNQNKTTLQDIQ
jgi:NACalpha-BTF3-like transcription factor